jgi:hypothetical protein
MPQTQQSLSPAAQRLVRLMQWVHFGRIEGLAVSGGEPVFDPAPRVIRHIKFGRQNGPRPELEIADFELKREVLDLFEQLSSIRAGVIRSLTVQHGLPVAMEIEEVAAA